MAFNTLGESNLNSLPQHPCQGKCTNFKEEPCHTCLVQQIEEQEFKYGLAPDDAYVKCDDIAPLFVCGLDEIESFHSKALNGGNKQ